MSAPGGGPDIGELLRRLGPDPLLRELEAAGLGVRGDRCRCPFPGCADKGKDGRKNVQIFLEGKPHVFCFACSAKGDLIDVLEATRRWTRDEALAHLRGQPAPIRPPLQLVATPAPEEDPKALKPAEVRRLWESLAVSDEQALRYLEGRMLEDAVKMGLVRFATSNHRDEQVSKAAKRGYQVCMQLTDVVGEPRGLQIRLARPRKGKEDPWISVRGSRPSRAFFGRPELIEAQPIVCVTEGGADTLAVAIWTADRPGIAVVGVSGKGNIHKLGKELEAAGIPVKGKLFLLFTQNDRPKNESRREFERLRQALVGRGARAIHVGLDDEFKDVADWLEKHPQAEWPPEDVAKALAFIDEEVDGQATPRAELPFAVTIPDQVKSDRFGQDFTTLCALLDDVGHREGIVGRRGEVTFSEMTHQVRIGGRPVEEVDLSAFRLGMEQYRTDQGKPLRFSEEDIGKALKLLGRRKTVHPVRDWLRSLKWDGGRLIDTELPAALGINEGAFASTLLSRWMLSLVARPLQPGCKVDTVLVLIGPQGIGKSTFFNVLAGDEWFTDSPVNVADRDGKMLMRKKWIVEWAELDAMRRARDKEAIRAFLSQRIDDFREPYGRGMVTAPRGCVIVGTTNDREFLRDHERRFFPVEVSRVDLAWLREHREQLLAEAVVRVDAGEQWHLRPEEAAELVEMQRDYEVRHPWTDLIEDWLEAKGAFLEVTAAQVLIECLKKPDHQLAHSDETTVGKVMNQLGWVKRRRSAGGSLRWVYVRPE